MDVLAVSITHCSDRDFLDAFRVDLAHSTDHVIILSPFLSRNRALYYYPVFRSLTVRQVAISVYAKPRSEQPEGLRDDYADVERSLRSAGVRFHVRPGMHEKLGVVDGSVLWHGSLNILSHNNTRESMLRIESSDLAQEILIDLGVECGLSYAEGFELTRSTPVGQALATSIETSANVPSCPTCGRAMRFFENADMWICPESPRCPGRCSHSMGGVVAHDEDDHRTGKMIDLTCPICGFPMKIRQGVFQRITCASEACGFTLDPRLSRGLLKMFSRRGMA